MTPDNWVYIGTCVYVVAFIVAVGSIFFWKIKQRGGRRPVDFKLLRGPGETLRRRIAKFDEDAILIFGKAALFPLAATLPLFSLVGKLRPQTWTSLGASVGFVLIVFVLLLAVSGKWMFGQLKRYRDDCLGYLGEREVAEHLMPLVARGYRVFHDVPAIGVKTAFNLDHVAVGPAGVALIETKTLRKGRPQTGKDDHVVEYKGDQLYWPWGSVNRNGLDQAINEADWLRKFIHQRTSIQTTVKPILALPGWWVERDPRERPVVSVVNSKNVAREIEGFGHQVLSEEQIDLIARQLDVLCRDVED